MLGFIYKIISPTNRVYIGQSINIERRFKEYQYLKTHNKQEVTIQQLKEILQPMENKEPKSNELKALLEIYYSCRDKHTVINKDEIFKKYGCLNSEYMSVCLKNFNLINLKGRRSKWIASKPNENMADGFLIFVKDYVKTKNEKQYLEIKNNNLIEPSLTEQLEKAKAEVKRLEDEIEDSKIKIGDWVISSLNEITEEQASEIVDSTKKNIINKDVVFKDYQSKYKNDFPFDTAIESLHSLLKSKRGSFV